MEQSKEGKSRAWAPGAAVGGLLSLLIVFAAVPSLPPCPDPVWIALDILAPMSPVLRLFPIRGK